MRPTPSTLLKIAALSLLCWVFLNSLSSLGAGVGSVLLTAGSQASGVVAGPQDALAVPTATLVLPLRPRVQLHPQPLGWPCHLFGLLKGEEKGHVLLPEGTSQS